MHADLDAGFIIIGSASIGCRCLPACFDIGLKLQINAQSLDHACHQSQQTVHATALLTVAQSRLGSVHQQDIDVAPVLQLGSSMAWTIEQKFNQQGMS